MRVSLRGQIGARAAGHIGEGYELLETALIYVSFLEILLPLLVDQILKNEAELHIVGP